MFVSAEAQEYPCPAAHIFRRETMGDKPRITAVRAIAREDLLNAVGGFQAIEDMQDDAIAEIRRYRSPRHDLRLSERDRMLRLARSVRKLAAARDAMPAAIERMGDASSHLIALECEIEALGCK